MGRCLRYQRISKSSRTRLVAPSRFPSFSLQRKNFTPSRQARLLSPHPRANDSTRDSITAHVSIPQCLNQCCICWTALATSSNTTSSLLAWSDVQFLLGWKALCILQCKVLAHHSSRPLSSRLINTSLIDCGYFSIGTQSRLMHGRPTHLG